MAVAYNCEYSKTCWRRVYTLYLQENSSHIGPLPDRFSMVLEDRASVEMAEHNSRKSLYAQNLPYKECRAVKNACPAMLGKLPETCEEYRKERAKRSRIAHSGRQKRPFANDRGWIPSATRRAVAARCGYKCVYCGIATGAYRNGKRVRTCVDHFRPLAFGGTGEESNLVLACFDCNAAKSDNQWDIGCRFGYY